MNKSILLVASIVTILASCKNTNSSNSNTENKTKVTNTQSNVSNEESLSEAEDQKKYAICLYDKLSIRREPSKAGKWITSMSLGERVTLTGKEHKDNSSKRERVYYEVKLIDGKQGWTQGQFLGINAEVGVLLNDVNVFSRPDLLNKTNKKYSAMDIIAILENKDDWLKIKGKRSKGKYIEEGWIKRANISNNEADIAVAKYTSNIINSSESMTERIKGLEEIRNNPDFSNSKFIEVISKKIEDYKSKNIIIDEPSGDDSETNN